MYMRDGMGGMHGGMMGMTAMQDPIARLLDHQAALHLTSAQVNNLIAIDDKLQADNRPIRQRMSSWHMAPGERRERGFFGGRNKPDSAQIAAMMTARQAMHDSMTSVMRAIRENNWRATSAAYALLNADQINTAAQLERGGPGMDGNRVFISRFAGPGGGPPSPGGFQRGRGMMRGPGGGDRGLSEPPGDE
jgi:hypothetical protein